ncbi:MAG: peptide deformylase [Acutalibacteraceae bacterium]|jgi:peptide deformylase|nr:peptide deformylase [Clostridia bacterium]MEE0981847.1 peptide deformylase [Acutalibacteraceae bacterium]
MAIRNIVKLGDPILSKKSRPVENFDEKLFTILDDMKDTLYKAEGAGLAAVQVGILRRVVVMDCGDGYLELVNPEIVERSEEVQHETEGCLSLPGKFGVTERPKSVIVKAQNREGKWCLYKGEGLKARCFCHEIDHLDGILYTSHVIGELESN